MLSGESSANVPAVRGKHGAPPPAPLGNQYAKGNKQKPDFLTKALITQLNETVKREVPEVVWVKQAKGKPKKRWVISQKTHTRIHFLVTALLENAMNGETDAIKYVFDRIEGRPLSTFPSEGDDGVVTVRFLPVDQRI